MIYTITMDKQWNIELYTKDNDECPVLDFIQSLPAKHQAKVEREIDLLQDFGINLTYPHTQKMEGDKYKGLWELRIKFASDISRIFYFLHVDDTYVLLNGFVKKTNKTPKKELDKAIQYKNDFLTRR